MSPGFLSMPFFAALSLTRRTGVWASSLVLPLAYDKIVKGDAGVSTSVHNFAKPGDEKIGVSVWSLGSFLEIAGFRFAERTLGFL